MAKKLNCILFIDDNNDDNFFHQRIIRKSNCAEEVVIKDSGQQALTYLKNIILTKSTPPDLIFLDINMPGMNGWEFLQEYDKIEDDIKSKVIVTMLTTSDNPGDFARAQTLTPHPLKAFKTKPLSLKMLQEIMDEYFSDNMP
jgi:CheY-like chemotaxis protein